MKKIGLYMFFVFFIQMNCFAVMEFFDIQRDFKNDNKCIISVYQNYSEFISVFQKIEKQKILIDIDGKTYEYFSDVYRSYSLKYLSNMTKFSITIRPLDKFYYNLKLGVVTSQNAKIVSSNTKLESVDNSYCGSLSLKYSVFPETIVNPSIMTGCGVEITNLKYSHMIDNNTMYKINTEINVIDTFFSITMGKKFFNLFETYCGGKIIFRSSNIIDKNNLYKISGSNYMFSLNIGNSIYYSKSEKVNFEFAWSPDNFSVSLGITMEY